MKKEKFEIIIFSDEKEKDIEEENDNNFIINNE